MYSSLIYRFIMDLSWIHLFIMVYHHCPHGNCYGAPLGGRTKVALGHSSNRAEQERMALDGTEAKPASSTKSEFQKNMVHVL